MRRGSRLLFPLCLTIAGAVGLVILLLFAADLERWMVTSASFLASFLVAVGLWSVFLESKPYERF
jgi:hypothetical protein